MVREKLDRVVIQGPWRTSRKPCVQDLLGALLVRAGRGEIQEVRISAKEVCGHWREYSAQESVMTSSL